MSATRLILAAVLVSACKPVLTWECPDPAAVQRDAAECHSRGAMFHAHCYEVARALRCTARCIAHCGDVPAAGAK